VWRWRQRSDRDFREEIHAHLLLDRDRLIAEGMSAADAKAAALRNFGNVTRAQERFYESRRVMWLDDLVRDVRYALRGLSRTPGFAAIAILTLALGSGANTAIFSVVNGVLLRPLPYPRSDRLIQVMENVSTADQSLGAKRQTPVGMDVFELAAFRTFTRTLSNVGTYQATNLTFTHGSETSRLVGVRISPAMLSMLGEHPLLGRTFESREENPGAEFVAILSYSAWQRYFGGAHEILGQGVTLDGTKYLVVGVMGPRFQFPDSSTEIWIPLPLTVVPGFTAKYPVLGQLEVGISPETASAEVSRVLERLRQPLLYPAPKPNLSGPPPFVVVRLQDQIVEPVRPALQVLMVAVWCVMLIACVNVANLILAKVSARDQEIAIRRAVGASRSRLIRQMLSENVVLSLLGGLGGIAFAFGGVRVLKDVTTTLARVDVGPGTAIPRLNEVGIDGPVLAYTLTISLVTGLLFGLAPALRQPRFDRSAAVRRNMRSGFSLSRHHWQGLLIVTEVALAIVLLVSGGLLMYSFVKLSRVDPGFDPTNVLTFQVALPTAHSSDNDVLNFSEALVGRIRSLPGVRHVGYAQTLPMLRLAFGGPLRRQADSPMPQWIPILSGLPRPPDQPEGGLVSRDFMSAMGFRFVEGSGFTDGRGTLPRIVINETLARSGFLGDRPIGAQIYSGRTLVEVVGVVKDFHMRDLGRTPDPQIFLEFRPDSGGPPLVGPSSGLGPYFAVRADRRPASLLNNIRAFVRQLDSEGAIDRVATMTELVSSSVARPRLYASLLGIFAAVALLLATVGIYGVTAYAVAQRTREIGIRMALGAQRAAVLSLVLRRSVALTGVGIALGLAAAMFSTRAMQGMLFGVASFDAVTFAGVSLLFAAVATVAAFIPARRASNVDPLVAFRCE
jgi:putative ABC transport system permease protein